MAKYLKINGNSMDQGSTVQTSAGAADTDKIPSLNASGFLADSIVNAVAASAGAPDAGKRVNLDSAGRIDSTMMPVGIGADIKTATASGALSAGNIINFDSTGAARVADCSNGRVADGFVLASVLNGASASVYLSGRITGLSGLTPGATYFLSTGGGISTTAPTTAGNTWQEIGRAVSTTELEFRPGRSVAL